MMLFDTLSASAKTAKLKVSALSDLVILHPNREDRRVDDFISGVDTQDGATAGTLVEGTVSLNLPSARKVDKLRVELIGKQSVWLKPAFEAYDTIHQTAKLDTGPQTLCPGEHSFKFSFVIPDDSAAFENSLYGRTYHKLVATAEGLGKFGSDLTAESVLYVISNHSESGGIPPGFDMENESEHPVLGPVGATLTSKYLLVSGYLRLSLVLPSIAQPVEINDVRVNLIQHFVLNSLKKPRSRNEEVKPVSVPLWSMKKAANWEQDPVFDTYQELSIMEQFRLPDDDKIRPSTAEGAVTGIKVKHELSVCIYYTPLENNPERQRREKKLSTPATLSSCCCIFDALQLPAYSSYGKDAECFIDKDAITFCTGCLCRINDMDKSALYGFTNDELNNALRTKLPKPQFKDEETYRKEVEAHHFGTSASVGNRSPTIHTGSSQQTSSDRGRQTPEPPNGSRAWQIRPPLRTRNSGSSVNRVH